MTTLTIPKKITKGEELIIIPLREYERFRHLDILLSQEKEADDDIVARRLSPPYRNKRELKKALNLLKR